MGSPFMNKVALITHSVVHFFFGICYLLPTPFFPRVAEEKGSSASEYGFIYGVFDFAALISSLICGNYIGKLRADSLCIVSTFVIAGTTILFGMVNLIQNHIYFTIASIIIRVIAGIADGAYYIGSSSLVMVFYPNNAVTVFSILEGMYGVGLLVGPAVGSTLYELGGFLTPFIAIGLILFLSSFIIVLVIRAAGNTRRTVRNESNLVLFKRPAVMLYLLTMITSSLSFTYVESMLEPHLRAIGLRQLATGWIIMVAAALYGIFTPIWGCLIDQCFRSSYIAFFGSVLLCIAFLFLGPVPYLKIHQTLWLTIISLACLGLGVAAQHSASYGAIKNEAFLIGYQNAEDTYGLLMAIFCCCWYLGCLLGPTTAGILMDFFGFQNTMTGAFYLNIIVLLCHLIKICCCNEERRSYTKSTKNLKREDHVLLSKQSYAPYNSVYPNL